MSELLTHSKLPANPLVNVTNLGFMDLQQNPALMDQFLAPALNVLEHYTRNGKDCPTVTDSDFIRLGCLRVLSQAQSGRDFLQHQREVFEEELERSTFFAVLHSQRRRRMLAEVSQMLYLQGTRHMEERGQDLLAGFSELSQRQVLAVDGHQIAHACHALRDDKGRHVGSKNLYGLCLHTGLMHNLGAVQGDGRYRHEMPVLRQQLPGWLKGIKRGKGRKAPILVLDPAFVDGPFWADMKVLRRYGALMVTRMKEHMSPEVYQERDWCATDLVNLGVQSDCSVVFNGGHRMRRIEYVDPETGQKHVFLTTVDDLPPGLIAWLYLLRWRIEKVFDTGKNKLQETKAWATGGTAREIQGHFFALCHNLLVLFSRYLQSEHGLEERKLQEKKAKALEERQKAAEREGRQVHPLHWQMPPVVQLSLQYIRTLRNHISMKSSLAASIEPFNATLSAYL